MASKNFQSLKTMAAMVAESFAQVPLAQEYVEYWHGAAFEVLGVRCVVSLPEAGKIVDLTPTIPVPGVKHWSRGIANIGGRVVSIADLSSFLSGGKVVSNGRQALMISGHGIDTALIIDASFGGVRFSADQLQTGLPVKAELKAFVNGVFESDDGRYAVFSIEKLLNNADFMEASVNVKKK